MKKRALGHIDCPTCGMENAMTITHDKNGEPYGYCEANCDQQIRIGGKKRRVDAFVARYPWAAGDPPGDPVPAPEAGPAPVPAAPPVGTLPKPAPEKKPKHWLAHMGVPS